MAGCLDGLLAPCGVPRTIAYDDAVRVELEDLVEGVVVRDSDDAHSLGEQLSHDPKLRPTVNDDYSRLVVPIVYHRLSWTYIFHNVVLVGVSQFLEVALSRLRFEIVG